MCDTINTISISYTSRLKMSSSRMHAIVPYIHALDALAQDHICSHKQAHTILACSDSHRRQPAFPSSPGLRNEQKIEGKIRGLWLRLMIPVITLLYFMVGRLMRRSPFERSHAYPSHMEAEE